MASCARWRTEGGGSVGVPGNGCRGLGLYTAGRGSGGLREGIIDDQLSFGSWRRARRRGGTGRAGAADIAEAAVRRFSPSRARRRRMCKSLTRSTVTADRRQLGQVMIGS